MDGCRLKQPSKPGRDKKSGSGLGPAPALFVCDAKGGHPLVAEVKGQALPAAAGSDSD